jgi:hypothetical protein
LGAGTSGFNPVAEDLTLQMGTYSLTLPAGSFTQKKQGAPFLFAETIDGVAVHVRIKRVRRNRYTLQADGSGANLAGITNPVTVTLTIGDYTASTQIPAHLT